MAIYLISMHESAYFERQRAGQVDIHDHTCLRTGQRRLGRWFVVSCIVEGFLGLRKLILVLRRELLTQFNFKSLGPRPDLYPNFLCTISMFHNVSLHLRYVPAKFMEQWLQSCPLVQVAWMRRDSSQPGPLQCDMDIPIYSNISIYNIFQYVSHNFHYVPTVQLVEHLTRPIFQFGG